MRNPDKYDLQKTKNDTEAKKPQAIIVFIPHIYTDVFRVW